MTWLTVIIIAQLIIDVLFIMAILNTSAALVDFREHYLRQEKTLTAWIDLINRDMKDIDKKVFNDK